MVTHHNRLRPMGGDGGELEYRNGFVYTISDGLIVSAVGYPTPEEALEAAGLSESAMSQENVEIVRRMLEAFNRGDVDAVFATLANSAHSTSHRGGWHPASGVSGHDGIREWMANLGETAEIQFEPTGFITNGDSVCANGWDAAWAGRRWPNRVETFVALRLRDGKIVRALGFLSRAEALEAAGLSE